MGWFLDRLVLQNSRHALPADEAQRSWLETNVIRAELFTWRANQEVGGTPRLKVIKYIGAGGRAENASMHPFDVWEDVPGMVTVANPPGYGASPGPPRLDQLVPLGVDTAMHTTANEHPADCPLLLTGNSLGGAVAIGVAAARRAAGTPTAGIIIRDPPHIADVIWQRFGWKSGWLPAALLRRRVPQPLDTIAAAEQCEIPAIIVVSGKDRVVPPRVQRRIVSAYAGAKRVITLDGIGHHDPIPEKSLAEYRDALQWMRSLILGSSPGIDS